MKDKIFFAKIKKDAIIPTKKTEDGCYDVYACFDDEYIIVKPHQIKMIPTGIASAFDVKYRVSIRERGSTGSIGLACRAGQIDSGYRGEWFIAINNTTDKNILITKNINKIEVSSDSIKYPYSKAICQAALEYVPDVDVQEITINELKQFASARGAGKLGSSSK
jgi:dUTP pyrophosphatase